MHEHNARRWVCQLHLQRTEGPNTKLVFLGIELDSVSMTISLPWEKQDCLCAMIQD